MDQITEAHNRFEERVNVEGFSDVFRTALVMLNYSGFCFHHFMISGYKQFLYPYLRHYGLVPEDLEEIHKVRKYFLDQVHERMDEPRIPRKIHRVWVTSKYNPKEMFDVLSEQEYNDFIGTTNVLNYQKDQGRGWEHYLWTNDKSLIPETEQWCIQNGIIVKEFKELETYDAFWKNEIEGFIDERLGTSVDLARNIIIYEHGGIYMDNDMIINLWDNEWVHYFDALYFRDLPIGGYELSDYMISNCVFLAKPGHNI